MPWGRGWNGTVICLLSEVDCLHWPQPDFFFAIPVVKVTPYAVCGFLLIICLHFLLQFVWASGIGSVTQVSEVSVIGGTYAYQEGCLDVSRFSYGLWGPYFHMCQSPTLLNCFGQVMHIWGIKIALLGISSLHLVFPGSLFRPCKSGIVLKLSIVRFVQGCPV